ncbi:transposable element tc3 transposase, putative [Rhizoctonia solani AG-3 Rhs1AP]|uniref:Transposable element tc3 transposase, putative n=2 Tax=Rhizoctonia solani AG-3 TaxID=1086053 RepID=X8IYE6_9AGAM|nr:transposable element tc3 transposase, putative [Rhizoctonia solani AG-3 Rhs1AP]KEP48777.1 putative transposable element tc3 transposase [Rhizoctonia solani 123E]
MADFRTISERVYNVTARQVESVAHKHGYHRCVARRKPFISEATIPKRIAWAEENERRDWQGVMWTDESKLETGQRPGQKRVTRRPGEENLHECIVPTFRNTRKTLDGAPAHSGKLPQAAREEAGIQRLTHPPSSPDLNPIEPIWNLLKNRIYDVPRSRDTIEGLWEVAQQVWAEITIEEINKHTRRMNDRVLAVKEAEGWHTPF